MVPRLREYRLLTLSCRRARGSRNLGKEEDSGSVKIAPSGAVAEDEDEVPVPLAIAGTELFQCDSLAIIHNSSYMLN